MDSSVLILNKIKDSAMRLKAALDEGNKKESEKLSNIINEAVKVLTEQANFNMDGVFFAGELDDNLGEKNILYPGDREDEEWKTIKGTHVLVDDEGKVTKGPEKLRSLPKNAEKKVGLSGNAKPSGEYDFDFSDDYQTFNHKNVGKLKSIYKEHGRDGLKDEYYKTRLSACSGNYKELSEEEIDKIIDDNIDKGVARLWYQEYNNDVKPKLVNQITGNKEIHNAALNVMYENYKNHCSSNNTEPLPFEEFLVTPIKMYRGGSGKEYKEKSDFSSYTFSKEVAERFKNDPTGHSKDNRGGVIYEAEIRPIDTYGSLSGGGEMEVLVPGFLAPNGKFDSNQDNRFDDDEDGRWVTTENGHKVHFNEEGEPDKGNRHVIGEMSDSGKRSVQDFLPKDSYWDKDNYKNHARKLSDARKKHSELSKEISKLDDSIKRESEVRPFDYDPDKEPDRELTDEEWDAILRGRKSARYLTDRGKELKKKKDEISEELKKVYEEEAEVEKQMRLIKDKAALEQRENWDRPKLEPAKSEDYEGFTLEKTGTSFGDEQLNDKRNKIAEMSPKEYLERCAYEIFDGGTIESTLHAAMDDDVQKYAEMMRNGEKFDLPYLNYRDKGQEGRHRALAAYLNGIEKIPVLIIGEPPTDRDLESDKVNLRSEISKVEDKDFTDDLDKYLLDLDLDGVEPERVNYDCDKDYKRALKRFRKDSVEAFRKRRKARLDAKDEEGRWITTENDHKIHLNEEGVPDKGNPHVIKAMTSGTKTREEIGRRRVEKFRAKIKDGLGAYKRADENVKKAAKEYAELDKKYRKDKSFLEHVDNIYKKTLDENGIKDGDREKLEKEIKDLEKKREENPYDRDIEAEYNRKKFFLAEYEDVYGEESKQRRNGFSKLEEDHDKAKKALDKHIEERRNALGEARKSMERNVQNIKFYTPEERAKIKDDFLNGDGVATLTDDDKAKIGESIDSASDAQLSVLQGTMKNARIIAVEDTARPDLCSHYSPDNGILYIEREDMSNPRVFWHEYGHYMDDFKHSGTEYGVVTHGEGTEYEGKADTFTSVLENEVKLFGKDCADDLQKVFDKVAPGRFNVKTNGEENYISVNDAKTGDYIDLRHESSYDLQKSFDKLIEDYIHGGPDGGEVGEYQRSLGFPDESERPKREDYIESYVTPKRKLEREREKYKGAEEEYYKKLNEYYDKQDQARAKDPDYNVKINEMYDRRREKEKLVSPVCDCLCAAMMGQVFSIYGCHDRDYYRTGYHAFNEWAANIHQMMFMQDKDAIDFMSKVLPKTMKKVKKAYNEYMWRNMSE